MKKLRIVLSLFDGMSCGQIALNRAGIVYEKYYASEIEKHAIKVTQHNYPNTIQMGDINNWREWPIEWDKVDLIFAGSPCQGFSFAGKQLAFDDPRSKLFFVFVDILNHTKQHNPCVKFLLENVVMKKEFEHVISNILKIEPISINSALVSAQSRKRLYWCNWSVNQPKDRHIYLKDVVDNAEQCARITGRKINPETGKRDDYNDSILTEQRIEPRLDNKCGTLTTVQKDNVLIIQKGRGNNTGGIRAKNGKTPYLSANSWEHNNFLILLGYANNMKGHEQNRRIYSVEGKSLTIISNPNGGSYPPKIGVNDIKDDLSYRRLTPVECERLQTVPENYTQVASSTQRYRMLGNGWTVDVIAHILSTIESRVESIAKQGIFNFE